MPLLRDKFDIRPLTKGISCQGATHIISNQLGKHIYHAGEIIDLHCQNVSIHVKLLGEVNDHMIGCIEGFTNDKDYFENMHKGQNITFDEDNIFECYGA